MCEHKARLPCFLDVKEHKCEALCDGILPCCGQSCKAKCHSCQEPAAGRIPLIVARTRHIAHDCRKPLYCGHACSGTCAVDHKCVNECQERCRQSCIHATCRLPCSTPCTPCQEPCTWCVVALYLRLVHASQTCYPRDCPHHSCPVPCGSVKFFSSDFGSIHVHSSVGVHTFTVRFSLREVTLLRTSVPVQ